MVRISDLLIDHDLIQFNWTGGFGHDFSDPASNTSQAVNIVSQGILAHGVTSFCPTLVTLDTETYRQIIPKIKRTDSNGQLASVLGIHLEGPFISRSKRGAHRLQDVQVTLNSFQELLDVYGSDLKDVAIITLAPENDVNRVVIKELVKRKIVVSLGHSDAGLEAGEEAAQSGAKFITHLFNAMLPFHHRDPGLVGLLTSKNIGKDCMFFGIIADGIHTHQEALKIAFRSNPRGLVLVTDAVSALGLEPGIRHTIGTQTVEIRDGSAFVSGTNTLCGSTATMDNCVRNLWRLTDCSVVQAIECATLHPAQVLGMQESRGSLNYKSRADLVLLHKDSLQVLKTFVAGVCVYKR